MPKRSFKQSLSIIFKGLAMGAADVVPGVSGGTIAFISGIYEELITTIHNLDIGVFKTLKLKSENKILTKKSVKKKEVYRDFTEGHLY